MIPDEVVISKILLIRGRKVMLDRDLASLYGVSTYRLNEQVKRNLKRFPEDFMFRLTSEEKEEVVKNYPHLQSLKFSPGLPYAFTEHGAVMAASVLNSDRAIEMNIQIVRIFSTMREMLINYKDILIRIEQMEKVTFMNSEDIRLIFDHIKALIIPPEQAKRKRIGFRREEEA